ncbi:MAG: hypothetical protein ACTSU2_14985 [Promethearchaeota archaeon]
MELNIFSRDIKRIMDINNEILQRRNGTGLSGDNNKEPPKKTKTSEVNKRRTKYQSAITNANKDEDEASRSNEIMAENKGNENEDDDKGDINQGSIKGDENNNSNNDNGNNDNGNNDNGNNDNGNNDNGNNDNGNNDNSNDNKSSPNKKSDEEEHQHHQYNYHFGIYISMWVIYFYFGIILPLNLLVLYFSTIFIPGFLMQGGLKDWNTWLYIFINPKKVFGAFMPILQNPISLIIFLTSPLVFVGLYLLKMFNYAVIMKFYYWLLDVIRPRRELLNAVPRGKTKADIEVYHTRNFLLRIIKWEFTKSPFPWLTNWMFNFIGSNEIGKNTTLEDGYVCQEYLETGKNVYVGFGSVTTSHLVEGIYGALILKKIILDDNVCIGARCAIPPGTHFRKNSQLLWYSAVIKYQKTKEGVSYWGLPASRLTRKKCIKLLKVPEEVQELIPKRRPKLKPKNKDENTDKNKETDKGKNEAKDKDKAQELSKN